MLLTSSYFTVTLSYYYTAFVGPGVEFVNLLSNPGTDSHPGGPVLQPEAVFLNLKRSPGIEPGNRFLQPM
jgi:hypothetical protein